MWRRQDRIDWGLVAGLTSAEKAELAAAKRRIAELETELAIHRRAAELLGDVVPPKTVRGDRGNGQRAPASTAGHPRARRLGVGLLRVARPGTVTAGDPARLADRPDPAGARRIARHLRGTAGAPPGVCSRARMPSPGLLPSAARVTIGHWENEPSPWPPLAGAIHARGGRSGAMNRYRAAAAVDGSHQGEGPAEGSGHQDGDPDPAEDDAGGRQARALLAAC